MKKKYYIFTAIASYFLLLIATIPAKPVTRLINDNTSITLQGISGTLWSGKAYTASLNNKAQLKNIEWSFNLWKLLMGQIATDIKTQYLGNSINAELGLSFLGRYFANNLTATIFAKDVAEFANIPLVQLSGVISLNIDHAQWKQGELPMVSGQINWKDATITVSDTVSLGDVLITLDESEHQLLNADISNQGGDIKVTGTAGLIPEADYAINIKLSPTASAGSNIKQSLGLFAEKQRNGDYLYKESGPLNQIGLM